MPPLSHNWTSHSLSTCWRAPPLTLHLNILQLPNTSSDISQVPPHSVFTMVACAAQTSQHTQIWTGPHHSQTATQLVHSCSCAEASVANGAARSCELLSHTAILGEPCR